MIKELQCFRIRTKQNNNKEEINLEKSHIKRIFSLFFSVSFSVSLYLFFDEQKISTTTNITRSN